MLLMLETVGMYCKMENGPQSKRRAVLFWAVGRLN